MTGNKTVPPNAELEEAIKQGVREKNNPQRYTWSFDGDETYYIKDLRNDPPTPQKYKIIGMCWDEGYARLICRLLNANEP